LVGWLVHGLVNWSGGLVNGLVGGRSLGGAHRDGGIGGVEPPEAIGWTGQWGEGWAGPTETMGGAYRDDGRTDGWADWWGGAYRPSWVDGQGDGWTDSWTGQWGEGWAGPTEPVGFRARRTDGGTSGLVGWSLQGGLDWWAGGRLDGQLDGPMGRRSGGAYKTRWAWPTERPAEAIGGVEPTAPTGPVGGASG